MCVLRRVLRRVATHDGKREGNIEVNMEVNIGWDGEVYIEKVLVVKRIAHKRCAL